MKNLGITALMLGIMSSVYFYSYTLMQIPAGLLFDRFQPKNIIVLSLLVCSLGSIFFGLVSDVYFGSFSRFLMGLGSAFAFISVLVVVSNLFYKKHFPFLTGVTQMLAALGAMVGQTPIRILVESFGWRSTMIGLGVVGALLSFVIWGLLKGKSLKKERQKSISEMRMTQKIHWFKSVKNDLGMIVQSKQTWYVAAYAFCLWAPMSGFASLWGVEFLVKCYHFTVREAAFCSSMMWLGLAVGSPILGGLTSVVQDKTKLLAGSAFLGFIAFAMVLYFHLPLILMVICLFFAGAACSGQALSFAVVKENNDPAFESTAIAFNNMAVVISGAFIQPIMGEIITHYHDLGALAYQYSSHVVGLAYWIGTLVAFFFIRDNR